MIGLALMAADLAAKRAGYGGPSGIIRRQAMEGWKPGSYRFSEEYYRIIDRLTRGEKP